MTGLLTPSTGLIYLGGLFDGEGSITLTRRIKDKREQFYSALSLSNTDERVLQLAQEILGGSINQQSSRGNYVCYNWYASHKTARAAAELLLPYTIIKQKELKILCDYYDAMYPLGIKQRSAARWGKFVEGIHKERVEIHERYREELFNVREENRSRHA